MQWFAVKCNPGSEFSVRREINKLRVWDDRIGQAIVVARRQVVRKLDKYGGFYGEKEARRAIAPGVVLVHMEMTSETWKLVTGVNGCWGFVGPEDCNPAPLDPAEVKQWRKNIKESYATTNLEISPISIGDRIKIKDGKFQEQEGIVTFVHNDKVIIKVQFLGREVKAVADINSVKKLGEIE